jgi:hypothetical protein
VKCGQRGGGHANEPGRYLSVKKVTRHGRTQAIKYFKVLAGGVHNDDHLALQQCRKSLKIKGQWVDQDQTVGPGNLN